MNNVPRPILVWHDRAGFLPSVHVDLLPDDPPDVTFVSHRSFNFFSPADVSKTRLVRQAGSIHGFLFDRGCCTFRFCFFRPVK